MATKKVKKMEIKIQGEDFIFDWTDEDISICTVNEQLIKLASLQSKGSNILDFSAVKQIVILDKYLKWRACEIKKDAANR